MELPVGQARRLNLGAGARRLEGYLSVDLDPEHAPDVVCDVLDLRLFETGSIDEIIAIHLLEHLPRWDAPLALAEWRRVLAPGGRLILELPDLVKCCTQVLTGGRPRAGLWGLYGDPNYKNPLMCHRWGWSPAELSQELANVGFARVRLKLPEFHKPYRDMRMEAWK